MKYKQLIPSWMRGRSCLFDWYRDDGVIDFTKYFEDEYQVYEMSINFAEEKIRIQRPWSRRFEI